MTAHALQTDRLILRPYSAQDIPDLVALIGAREIAATTLRIPHPYTEADARDFLATIGQSDNLNLAIVLQSDNHLCGGIGLRPDHANHHAELGYWIGVPYWGHGYATEAARALVQHGFEALNLTRIYAFHFKHNPASGRVLQKIGMRHEGCQRAHIYKWGQLIDLELYGLLRSEWKAGP
jgi:RimJ/RimL family protein N-acetyltransferase